MIVGALSCSFGCAVYTPETCRSHRRFMIPSRRVIKLRREGASGLSPT